MTADHGPLRLIDARQIAAAAWAAAQQQGIHNISVVVTDVAGAVLLAHRADTQGNFGIDTACAKARSALGWRMSTARLAQVFSGDAAACAGVQAALGGCFMPIAGAVVLADDSGRITGAASISGGNPEADDRIVRTAAAKAGFQALD